MLSQMPSPEFPFQNRASIQPPTRFLLKVVSAAGAALLWACQPEPLTSSCVLHPPLWVRTEYQMSFFSPRPTQATPTSPPPIMAGAYLESAAHPAPAMVNGPFQ